MQAPKWKEKGSKKEQKIYLDGKLSAAIYFIKLWIILPTSAFFKRMMYIQTVI